MKVVIQFLALFFLFISLKTAAQSLEAACKTAKKENKLVMVVVRSESCRQCNDVADKGLSSEMAQRVIKNSCVLIQEKQIPQEINDPYKAYSFPENFFGVIYMDADKNILRVYNGSSSMYKTYLDNLELAIQSNNSADNQLNKLVNEYYSKPNDFNLTIQLIKKIMGLGLEVKQELLDNLVQKAPADSATSLSFLQFVMRAGPTVGSLAATYTEKNQDNYNMAWYRMSLQERIAINNKIYHKSMQKAIAEKDISYAYRVAGTRQQTSRSQPQIMQKVYQEAMLQYYKGVKDSAQYLANVVRFYDNYFMYVNADSIHKVDSINKEKVFNGRPIPGTPASGNSIGIITETGTVLRFTPQAGYYGASLNDGAWTIYMYTDKPYYISKALEWSRRSLEFNPVPELMDTYARLLYKSKNKEAAIEWESKAIDANNQRKMTSSEYEKVLTAMKQGLEKIDEY
jgi:hypothetical protein